jgi:plastocyanin
MVLLLALVPAQLSFAGAASFKFVDSKQAPIADAVVSLIPLDGPAALKPVSEPVVIRQEKEEFLPYVSAVQVGTAVDFPNRDVVKHHVYSGSKAKKFELPLYAGEAPAAVVFDQPGVVTLGCNIHDWMLAYVVVLETPWFAKSDDTGAAGISAVPAGRYRAEIWHPRLTRPLTRELTVTDAPSGELAVTLTLGRDRRIRRNLDAKGGGYK